MRSRTKPAVAELRERRVEGTLGIPLTARRRSRSRRSTLPPSRIVPPRSSARSAPTPRVIACAHSYGRGYRDLVRAFRGDFASPPDWVFSPESEDHIASLLLFCEREDVAVVPFGGGTSVVGGVESVLEKGFRGVVDASRSRSSTRCSPSRSSIAPRASRPARSGPAIETALAAARAHAPPLPAELRVLHARRLDRDPRRRALRDAPHPHRRLRAVGAHAHPARAPSRRTRCPPPAPAPPRTASSSAPKGAFGIIVDATMRLQEAAPLARARHRLVRANGRRGPRHPRPRAVGPPPGELPSPRSGRGARAPSLHPRRRGAPPRLRVPRSSARSVARTRALDRDRSRRHLRRRGPLLQRKEPRIRRPGNPRSSARPISRAPSSASGSWPTPSRPRARGNRFPPSTPPFAPTSRTPSAARAAEVSSRAASPTSIRTDRRPITRSSAKPRAAKSSSNGPP